MLYIYNTYIYLCMYLYNYVYIYIRIDMNPSISQVIHISVNQALLHPMASLIPDSCQSNAQRSSRASRHAFDLGDLTFIYITIQVLTIQHKFQHFIYYTKITSNMLTFDQHWWFNHPLDGNLIRGCVVEIWPFNWDLNHKKPYGTWITCSDFTIIPFSIWSIK